jgi:hypothetical protein
MLTSCLKTSFSPSHAVCIRGGRLQFPGGMGRVEVLEAGMVGLSVLRLVAPTKPERVANIVACEVWYLVALLHRFQEDNGPGEGSTSPFADQARPGDESIRPIMDTGGHLVSIARLKRRAQRTMSYSIDNR